MIKIYTLFLLAFTCGLYSQAYCQDVQLLTDINPGTSGSFVWNDNMVIEYQDVLYFVSDDGTHGSELWAYDGTSTYLVKDINPGSEGSDLQNMYLLNGKFIFTAEDDVHGIELWTSDGTELGTEMVIDLGPGAINGTSHCCSSEEFGYFAVFNNELYFSGSTTSSNRALYKTDGTAGGTQLVKVLNHPQRSGQGFREFNGELYFKVTFEGFWKTDGTTDGTVLIMEEDPSDGSRFDPIYITDMGDYMLMMNGNDKDLWRSDGTASGTVKLMDLINPQTQNNQGNYIVRYGDLGIFAAADRFYNAEMWRTDGTTAGTNMITDIELDTSSWAEGPKRRILFDGLVYFVMGSREIGYQLYRTDATESGTELVVNLDDLTNGEIYFQTDLVTNGQHLFFVGGRAFNRELWVTDGTESGTFEIEVNPNGESTPERLTFYKDKLFMFANGDGVGYEPHILDLNSISAVTEIDDEAVTIFPIPANDRITIQRDKAGYLILNLFDLSGRAVMTTTDSHVLDVRNVPNGTYLLQLVDRQTGSTASQKVQIIH